MTGNSQSTNVILETCGESLDTRHILTEDQDYELKTYGLLGHTLSFPHPCSNSFMNSQVFATYNPLKSKLW